MSKKDIARTLHEAGHTSTYQFVRREQRRQHRHEAKAYCQKILRNAEVYEREAAPVAPEHRDRRGLWRDECHRCTVGPVLQWMLSHAGRRWDSVYSDIRHTFSRRARIRGQMGSLFLPTMRDFMTRDGEFTCGRSSLFLDEDLILRKHLRPMWRSRLRDRGVPEEELATWLAGRRVLRCGDRHAVYGVRYFWGIREEHRRVKDRVESAWVDEQRDSFDRWHLARKRGVSVDEIPAVECVRIVRREGRFRQDRALMWDEFSFFHSRMSSAQRAQAMDLSL